MKETFAKLDQRTSNINFDVEVALDRESLIELSELYNLKETASNPYLSEEGILDIHKLRDSISDFLPQMFAKNIKIKTGKKYPEVTIKSVCHSEELRFNATMENDKIGGFSPSSMTPGKQALFALSLLLDESTDTWPLLIDQPEDDLDSRSIYESIVAFLKEKKKESK